MKKVSKIGLRVLLVLLLLMVIAVFAMRLPSVQNYLARRVAIKLSKDLKTEVKIGGLYFTPISKVVISDVLIRDRKNDTLIYVKKLKVGIKNYDIKNINFELGKTVIDNAYVNFGTYKNDSINNYGFFIDYFNKKDTTKPPSKKTSYLNFSKVKFINTKFRYFDENSEAPDYARFNPSNLVFSNINASVKNLKIIDDSLNFKINSLTCNEASGLSLKQAKCVCIISGTTLGFDNMHMETNNSTLKDNIVFKYKNYADLGDFLNKAYMTADMKNSHLAWSDLRYFHNNVPNKNGHIVFNGIVKGPISNLRSKNLTINIQQTKLRGDVIISGLPDVNNMFFDVGLKQFKTNAKNLKSIFNIHSLPPEAKTLGNIQYTGRVTGFLRDFVTYGNLNTALGNVKSDLNLKFTQKFEKAQYSGILNSKNFDLGTYLGNKSIGKIALNAQLKGKGMTQKDFYLDINGDINSLELNGETIKDLTVNGILANNQFKGKAISKAPNMDLDFDGYIDFSGREPIIKGVGKVKKLNLASLGLDTSVVNKIALIYNIDLKGTNVSTLGGGFSLKNISLYKNETKYSIDSMYVNSSGSGKNKNVVIKSDWFNATAMGQINPDEIINAFKYVLNNKIPSLINTNADIKHQDFSFNGKITKPKKMFSLFDVGVSRTPISFNGNINTINNSLILKTNTDSINFEGYIGSNFKFTAITNDEGRILISTNLDEITLKDNNFESKNIDFKGSLFNDIISYNIGFGDDTSDLSGFMSGQLNIDKNMIKAVFDPSVLMVKGQAWNVGVKSAVVYRNNVIEFDSLMFFKNDQSLLLDGIISKNRNDWIKVKAEKFDLYTLTPFIMDDTLKGELTGELKLQLKNKVPNIVGDANVSGLSLNNDTIGDVNITSKLSNKAGMLKLDAMVKNGFLEGLNVRGSTTIVANGNNKLNLSIKIPHTNAQILNKQFKGLFSEIQGDIYGRVFLKGDANNPKIQGKIYAEDISLNVDFLETKLYFNTAATINNSHIMFNQTQITDGEDGTGMFYGNISHNMFDDFKLDLKIDKMKNIRALNTQKEDNDLFYGTAYVDGNFAISGPLDGLDILLNATSRKKTFLNLPLADDIHSGPAPYIQFVSKTKKKSVKKASEGMDFINNLDLNISVTEDAQVKLIFDETVGDIIKGKGNGQLRITLDKSAEFKMFGNYIISEGDYLFTAFYNLINKKFSIKPGGKIQWTGDPYHAQLDLVAIYKQKSSPKVLMSDFNISQESALNKPIDVQSNILIKGDLLSPKIEFDLEFPNLNLTTSGIEGTNLQSVLKRIKTDKEELNKQVFSLIVFGSFIEPNFAQGASESTVGATDALNTSAGDLIGSQLSNWLSKVMPGLEVDLQVNGSLTADQSQRIVASIAKRFFKGRLLIGGTFDASASSPDFNMEYDITTDGKTKLKVFKKTQIDYNYQNNNNLETYGVGIKYRKDFNYIWKRKKRKK